MKDETMKELHTALAAAQKQACAVSKDATNPHHRYAYASAEAVIAEARDPLSDNGLAFFASAYEIRQSSGGDLTSVKAVYTLTHASGQALTLSSETPVLPERGRPLDKALATAKTYDLSYMLRALLLLPRVDAGEDVDARDDSKPKPEAWDPSKVQDAFRSLRKSVGDDDVFADALAVEGIMDIEAFITDLASLDRDSCVEAYKRTKERLNP